MRIIILLILLSNIFAQISQGGMPKYYQREATVDFISPNRENLVDRNFHPMVFQFGEEYSLDINILEAVEPVYDEGVYTYLLGIKSIGAYGIGFIFDNFYLSENSTVFLYDSDKTMYLGSFTSENNKDTFTLPTSIIKSDHVVIEINIPENEVGQSIINLGTMIHDYEDVMGYYDDSPSSTMNREDCNVNVACPEGDAFEDQINSTIRVTMGGGLCSGSIVNNTANDSCPIKWRGTINDIVINLPEDDSSNHFFISIVGPEYIGEEHDIFSVNDATPSPEVFEPPVITTAPPPPETLTITRNETRENALEKLNIFTIWGL